MTARRTTALPITLVPWLPVSKTLTYTVNVAPGVFVAAGNKDVQINNRACIYTDDSREGGGVWLNGHNASKTINRKVWSRKLAGGKQETKALCP